ncbi:MAG: 2-oxoacid:acceptor oxidoreductase family protein [Deltaproteobacteria bacterium]|nr:2-oxoacid:acceptor oxidoreductase family protein [Deltaproteobacteria bacterium]
MLEIRIHGRGGQGAVTSVELLAIAAIEEGKYAQGFPSFGPERRGAPVMAFCRIDERPIRLRSKIYNPDVVMVLDPSLLGVGNPSAGIKDGGIVIINTHKSEEEVRKEYGIKATLALVDGYKIAREELGAPITNTTMLGALFGATKALKNESMEGPLRERFGKIGERNVKAFRRACTETAIFPAKT